MDKFRSASGRGQPLGIDPRDQPEALAIEQHIRRKRPLSAEIVAMRPPPEGERTVALAFLEGEGCVDFVKAPLHQLDGLDYRDWITRAVEHDPSLAGSLF
jgi:hypothetical protein